MAVPMAHYNVVVSPPEPSKVLVWPSMDFVLRGLEHYPDDFILVRVAVPMTWRPVDVQNAFGDWGDCSVCLQQPYMIYQPRPSVWNTREHVDELLAQMLGRYQHECYLRSQIVEK